MDERVRRTTVEFMRPFELDGVDGPQPAGVYDVETVEAPLEGVSFLAYRRLSTTIALPARHVSVLPRHMMVIDPADLAAALDLDAEASHGKSQI